MNLMTPEFEAKQELLLEKEQEKIILQEQIDLLVNETAKSGTSIECYNLIYDVEDLTIKNIKTLVKKIIEDKNILFMKLTIKLMVERSKNIK